MSDAPLAIDFGTSNSAAAILDGAAPRRLPVEGASDTLPTAVFFPAEGGAMRIGAAAAEALIEGDEGRYMRALKSVLGTALFHEQRLLGGRRRTLADVVAAFLAEVKARAEAASGRRFASALSGRPVRFHADPARDARAEADLRACYLAAGFEDVRFMYEPEAAALAAHGLGRPGETGLVIDIGGGTSDFSAFRVEGGRVAILASHGVRLGGTDFDHAVSMSHAMPLLGLGGELREPMGGALRPVPNATYVELSTWATIPFLYTRETERLVEGMAKEAVDPAALNRLAKVIHDQRGHELAFAVEAGKIAANGGDDDAAIDMGCVERGLRAPISPASLDASLAGFRAELREAMAETLRRAGIAPEAVGSAILVGGSSLMGLVAEEARAACPQARIERSDAFGSIVDGLALAAALPAARAA
ncbi:Hsp70 family protein [Albimonas sp. CAU 1670]|uniref:Hsp70 family protein n=1 Tax=Albimonas sp. CAU 1670 TaxID=3032599 RepID=UPI0023DBFB68|nr:Hsp70 family protein [Albimonas sp. CAU 1670]MDF2233375.1 Hsp70 family protein [Albimonas sp. CAU 1670]